MSEETEDGTFGTFEPEPSLPETDGSWLDEEAFSTDDLERLSAERERSGATNYATTFSRQ